MIFRRLFFLVALISWPVFSYDDRSLTDFDAGFDLPPNSLEASFTHRFYGPLDTDGLKTVFGLGSGANARIKELYISSFGLLVDANFTTDARELSFGAGYAVIPKTFLVNLLAYAQLSSDQYWDTTINDLSRKGDLYLQMVAQTKPFLFKRLLLTVALGYDLNENKPGLATGFEVVIRDNVGIIGELAPVTIKKVDNINFGNPSYSIGARVSTFGHQFIFFVGNATGIGPRKFLYGSGDYHLRLGFEIKRLFNFGHN